MTNRQLFLQHLAQTSDFPLMLEVERAEGVYLVGPDGKKWMDLISGIGVSNIGHRHPEVIDAIHSQLDKHLHTMVYGELVQSPQVQLAKALSDTLPENLSSVYFVNSGSEAVEGALKLAKRFTNRTEFICFKDAYHGSSHGALSASGNEKLKQNFRPLVPGFSHFGFNDLDVANHINQHTAAVLMEVVQGEAGVIPATKEFLQALRKRCDETGTLLIFDEIQTGFGRTGKFWAFEHFGVVPDVLISAKGMGGGMPIGCFISSPEIMRVLQNNPVLGHITTFGGHPVCAAASLATLKVIANSGILSEVAEKEKLFKQKLIHPKIKHVRSFGLMIAVEFESFEVVKPIIDKAIEIGVLTDWFLFNDRSMRIAPPLTISEGEIEWACNVLLKAMDS
jgi:putrescine aminotransferase